jgi:hypothetical protein
VRRSVYLDEIRRPDPERDHERIVHLDVYYEFPYLVGWFPLGGPA